MTLTLHSGREQLAARQAGIILAQGAKQTHTRTFWASRKVRPENIIYLFTGVDHYLAILYPLEYPTKVTPRVSFHLILLVWGLGLVASALGGLQLLGGNSPWHTCRSTAIFKPPAPATWTIAALDVGLLFLLPVSALSFIYLKIFIVARSNSRDIRRQSFNAVSLPTADGASHMDVSVADEHHGAHSGHQANNGLDSNGVSPPPPKTVVAHFEETPAAANGAAVRLRKLGSSSFDAGGYSASAITMTVLEPGAEISSSSPSIDNCGTSRMDRSGRKTESQPGDSDKRVEETKTLAGCRRESKFLSASTPISVSSGNNYLAPPPLNPILHKSRAPKLSLLRHSNGGVFATPVSSSLEAGPPPALPEVSETPPTPTVVSPNYPPSLATPSASPLVALHRRQRPRNRSVLSSQASEHSQASSMSGGCLVPNAITGSQGSLASSGRASVGSSSNNMPTPKRKCSFSSFSECRMLEEDGARHHTFLFSIEAPSPPASPGNTPPKDGGDLNDDDVSASPNPNLLLTASQRRRRFSQASLTSDFSSASSATPWTSKHSTDSTLRVGSASFDVDDGAHDGDDEHDVGNASPRHGRLRKSGSILSITSQVG